MKLNLIKISIILVVLFFVAGAIFFKKDAHRTNNSSDSSQTAQTATQITEIESNGGAAMLENFMIEYDSYTYGDFINVENLYPYMTDELRASEEKRIKGFEDSSTGTPNVTVKSQVKKAEMESYDAAAGKLTLKVTMEESIFGGIYVHNPDYDINSEINPQENIVIDRAGNKYGGDLSDLLEKKQTAMFRISGVKESQGWRVREIQKLNQ